MKRILAPRSKIVLTLAALALAAGIVWAANPHFVSAKVDVDGVNLIVSWKEAGLGNNQLISYEASADAIAEYVCINGGRKHPQAANKETVSGPVSATGTFSSGRNGQITQSLTLEPPGPGTFACPPGQRLVLACVEYSNVELVDLTTPVSVAFSGDFRATDATFGRFCSL